MKVILIAASLLLANVGLAQSYRGASPDAQARVEMAPTTYADRQVEGLCSQFHEYQNRNARQSEDPNQPFIFTVVGDILGAIFVGGFCVVTLPIEAANGLCTAINQNDPCISFSQSQVNRN